MRRILLVAALAVASIAAFVAAEPVEVVPKWRYQDFEENGKRAFRLGVPATANPAVAEHHRLWWLEGWMTEAEKQQKRDDDIRFRRIK